MKTEIHVLRNNLRSEFLYSIDGILPINNGDMVVHDYSKYYVERKSLDIMSNKGFVVLYVFVK